MKFLQIIFLTIILIISACESTPELHTKKGLVTPKAMVVSAHPLATEVGKAILQKGGNAVDAMVGVQFALAVTLPAAGNIGGGGFMVMRKKDGTAHTLDFREMAPSAAFKDMYLDSLGNVIENLSFLGHLAAGVPGSVAGMVAAHDSLGKLPWKELVQPAIDLARNGFPLTKKEAWVMTDKQERLRKYTTRPSVYTSQSEWKEGDPIAHPELAKTLEAIRDYKNKGFYEGWVADSIVAEMARGNGIMSLGDLKKYHAVWRAPIRTDYKGYGLISMPPPSSGGVALAQLLELVEPFPLNEYGWHDPKSVHVMVEAERRVYADRAEHLGDADYWKVPVKELMDAAYLKKRMADFDPAHAVASDAISPGQPAVKESEQTTHYSIVDAEGNAIAVTTTLNGSYGCYVTVGGAGFLLNNEMDDFSAKPGVPNFYGLIGNEANAIEPGKRMLSSMTPTIVSKNNKLFMVVGTPGGSTIITSVFQTFLNVSEYGMSMQGAVSVGRFHHQWKPDKVFYEKNALTAEEQETLKKMGHILEKRGNIGRVDAILVLPDGSLEAGADPRGDDHAAGF